MSPTELAAVLEHARKRTEALLEPLDDEQLTRQVSPLQSPLVWDLAHIGYFEELWLLRNGNGRAAALVELDDLYDSFAHDRAERDTLPILSPEEARAYVGDVREQVLERLPELARNDFLVGMVAQHELQHGETMAQTLALAGLPGPPPHGPPEVEASGDVLVEAGPFTLGSDDTAGPTTTNGPSIVVELPAFRIDRALVTNAEYAEFVAADGAEAPQHWTVDRQPASRQPVQHVSFHDAEEYARWTGKRLPTEPEWEKAVKTVRRRARARAGSRVAVDVVLLRRLPGLPRIPLRGVLGSLLRRGLSRAARRVLGHRPACRATDLPQLGSSAAAADLLRHPVRVRCLTR